MPRLAGPDRQSDREVCLSSSWRTEEHHVVLGHHEVQGAQMSDDVTLEPPSVVEVELLQRLSRRKPRRPDAALTTVRLPRGDFALQTRHQELLVTPGLGPGALGEALHRLAQRRCLEGPGQEGDLGREITGGLGCGGAAGGHHATPPSRSFKPSAVS